MARVPLAFAVLVLPTIAFADEPPSPLEIEARVDQKLRVEFSTHCADGNALDQAFCLKDRLGVLDAELDELVARAIRETKNLSGPEATEEQRQNIKDAQAAWKTYRQEHCWFDYVPHQVFNASSRQADNMACEIRRTYQRMEEVRISYMFDWR